MSEESDLYFGQHPVGQMANLAYLVGSVSERKCLVVDPAWNVDGLLDQAEADGMEVVGAGSAGDWGRVRGRWNSNASGKAPSAAGNSPLSLPSAVAPGTGTRSPAALRANS